MPDRKPKARSAKSTAKRPVDDLPIAERSQADHARFAAKVFRSLEKEFGPIETPLTYKQPHELVIAVILSAQCTDEQVNRVTPDLFREYPNPEDFYNRPVEELEKLIYSTGFYKNKARSIRGFARMLVTEKGNRVPDTLEELIKMPGIGRKTANVVLNELYDKAEGIVVDTHVARISKVLGFSKHRDAVKVERDLMQKIPRKFWRDWALLIIFLGRKYCTARKRHCDACVLKDICPSRS